MSDKYRTEHALHTVQISPVRRPVAVVVNAVAATRPFLLAAGGDAAATVDLAGGLEDVTASRKTF